LRWLGRAALCALAIWALTAAALALYAAVTPPLRMAAPMPADIIMVLGGGPSADRLRIVRAAELYHSGQAPALHITSTPRSAVRMAALANAAGIPAGALTIENRSYSTLQNALFSQAAIGDADHLILVTETWHLPRARASFALAGDQRLSMAASARFGPRALRMIAREAAAIWFNAGRATVWAAAGWFEIPRSRRDTWLR
jgi:uncharacterized SAM-binding protein YcdF (DUF218 family)